MTYLTENPWPLALTFAFVALFLAFFAMRSGESKFWKIAAAFVALAVIPFVTDQLIQTDREVVMDELLRLRDTVVSGNATATLELVDGKDALPGSAAETIRQGMSIVKVHEGLRIKSVQVETNGTEATSDFRANGTVDVKGVASNRHAATRWRLKWVKRAAGWKIKVVERLNPLTGEVMGVFSSE